MRTRSPHAPSRPQCAPLAFVGATTIGMQKYVKRIGDERLTKVPADLDLKPYRDEHDDDLVQRMLASITRGQAPRGVTANHVKRAVVRYMPQLTYSKSNRRGNRAAAR